MVGAEHAVLGISRPHAALQLLEAAQVNRTERLDVHLCSHPPCWSLTAPPPGQLGGGASSRPLTGEVAGRVRTGAAEITAPNALHYTTATAIFSCRDTQQACAAQPRVSRGHVTKKGHVT